MRHINIPIFVPHLGCPHTCVFCNQHTITGLRQFSLETFSQTVETVLATAPLDSEKEIAFFGGSFTAIDRNLMLTLLAMAKEYVDRGAVNSIRLSTRPDAIDDEILTILRSYKVSTIELGIQTTDLNVLIQSRRGHTAEDSKRACQKIKSYGFTLVGQMMLGLPRSTFEKELKTAQDMVSWGIDAVRIYPTVVFPDTALAEMNAEGTYAPLSVDAAIERCAFLLDYFEEENVPVIRIGLCETEGLHNTENIRGAYHPALGELCLSRLYRFRILSKLSDYSIQPNSMITVEVAPKFLSQAIGQNQCNLQYFRKIYPECHFFIKPSLALRHKEVKILTKEN